MGQAGGDAGAARTQIVLRNVSWLPARGHVAEGARPIMLADAGLARFPRAISRVSTSSSRTPAGPASRYRQCTSVLSGEEISTEVIDSARSAGRPHVRMAQFGLA